MIAEGDGNRRRSVDSEREVVVNSRKIAGPFVAIAVAM